jgi:hypothetical protein
MDNIEFRDLEKEKEKFRTNITIKDKDLWNWFKYESRNKEFNSLSNYINFLIKSEKENNIFDKILLEEFEKYYKFISYSHKSIANKLDLRLGIILKFMKHYELPISNKDTFIIDYKKNLDYIHKIMFDKQILPLEFRIIRGVFKKFRFPSSVKYQDILDIIFDDPDLKTGEIFNYILIFFNELDFEKFQQLDNENLAEKYDSISKIIKLFYEYGIELEKDDLEIDLYFSKLKEKNSLNYYALVTNLVILCIIKRELISIRNIIANGFYHKLYQEKMLPMKLDTYISEKIDTELIDLSDNLKNYNPTIPKLFAEIIKRGNKQ